jgi:hypothetical protein
MSFCAQDVTSAREGCESTVVKSYGKIQTSPRRAIDYWPSSWRIRTIVMCRIVCLLPARRWKSAVLLIHRPLLGTRQNTRGRSENIRCERLGRRCRINRRVPMLTTPAGHADITFVSKLWHFCAFLRAARAVLDYVLEPAQRVPGNAGRVVLAHKLGRARRCTTTRRIGPSSDLL